MSEFIVNELGHLCLLLNEHDRKLVKEAYNFNGSMLRMNAVNMTSGKLYLTHIADMEEAE